jgi:two-component system sensor histidine kinase/response regulator
LWKALLKWIKPHNAAASAVAIEVATRQLQHDLTIPSAVIGLDTVNGLRRVLGKKPLYISMLRKFVDGQSTAVAEISKALSNHDQGRAELVAHTLKGVAGNIGATELKDLAQIVETDIREHRSDDTISAHLESLGTPLAALIAAVKRQLPPEPARAAVQVDVKKLNVVCHRLSTLLAQADAEAEDVLNANTELLSAAFPDHFHQIDDAIRSFKFDRALAALNEARPTVN